MKLLRSPILKDADFRRLFLGVTGNSFGMSCEHVLVSLLAYQVTGSTAWVGFIMAIYFLPFMVVGSLAGAIADWMDRRALLRRVELAIAANLVIYAGLWTIGLNGLDGIIGFALVAGVLRALHQPARSSYTFDLVGSQRLVAGLSLISLSSRGGQLVGALVSGFVMEIWGLQSALVLAASVHCLGYLCFRSLRDLGLSAPAKQVAIWTKLREYLQEMRKNRVLLTLVLLTSAVEVFGFSFTTVLPELAATRFNVGADGLGMMHAARALGGIVASVALALSLEFRHRGTGYLVVIFCFGGALIALAWAPHYALALIALFMVACCAAASDILTQSMVQLAVENELRGRAMGAWTLAVGMGPVGHFEIGLLVLALGVSGALTLHAVALLVLGLFTVIAVPRLRKL